MAASPHKLIDVQIQGGDQARANLAAWWGKAQSETAQAFGDVLNNIIMESQAECPYDYENPHDTGTPHLRDTVLRTGPGIEGNSIVAYISYNTPYAVIVHENPNVRHHYPTKWKFLEDPATRNIPTLLSNIQMRIKMIQIGSNEPLISWSDDAASLDYSRWLSGTLGGRNTAQSWGKQWHSGNVYPIKSKSEG